MLELHLLVIIFAIQWLAFIPAYFFQTERFYDLVGGLTYILTVIVALILTPKIDARTVLLASLIMVWAFRLGLFLFIRIHAAGGDSRFDQIKRSPLHFFITWTLQALWISITASAALFAILSPAVIGLGLLAYLGLLLWCAGFAMEAIADFQKSRFKQDPTNAGRFIQSGLWSWCRHPNYTGEILLWIGVALIALPVLEGWRYTGLLSPLFVAFLLIRISGIPLLERAGQNRWGDDVEYQAYLKRTPKLMPGF